MEQNSHFYKEEFCLFFFKLHFRLRRMALAHVSKQSTGEGHFVLDPHVPKCQIVRSKPVAGKASKSR